MALDIRTLALVAAVMPAFYAVGLWLLGRSLIRLPGLGTWAAASGVESAGFFTLALVGVLPAWTGSVLANVLLTLSAWLVLVGNERFRGIRDRLRWILAGVIAVETVVLVTAFVVVDSRSVRVVTFCLVAGAIWLVGAWRLVHGLEPRLRATGLFTAGWSVLLAVALAVRAVGTLAEGAPPFLEVGRPLQISLLLTLVASTGQTFGFVWMSMQSLAVRLEDQAVSDPLTGLPNRRAFWFEVERSMRSARRDGGPLALAMLDLDHFKRINDTYHHHSGDLVLQRVGQVLGRHVRPDDGAFRVGGEEFAIVMPATTTAEASVVADRLCREIAAVRVTQPGRTLSVTASIGVSATDRFPGAGAEDLLRIADDALYRAKSAGRNRVEVAGPVILTDSARRPGR